MYVEILVIGSKRGVKMVKGIHLEQCNIYEIHQCQEIIQGREKSSIEAIVDDQGCLECTHEYTYKNQKRDSKGVVIPEIKVEEILEEEAASLYGEGIDIGRIGIQEMTKSNTLVKETIDSKDNIPLRDKIALIKEEKDGMYLNSLLTTKSLSINELYANVYKGNLKRKAIAYTPQEVSSVLKLNGIREDTTSIWAANMLMMYDIGVNPENVLKLQNMQSAIGALDKQYTGSLTGETVLIGTSGINYTEQDVEQMTEDLENVTEQDIKQIVQEGKPINIKVLRQSIHKRAKQVLKGKHKRILEEQQGDLATQEHLQVKEIKQQLEMITKRLTVESARKISERMPLESSLLIDIVSQIRNIAVEEAKDIMIESGVVTSDSNIKIMMATMAAKEKIENHFIETIGIQVATEENSNLSEIQAALIKYTENETKPKQQFGEDIKKVINQIEQLLKNQGIIPSEINKEAAKALIKGGLDVSQEHLGAIQSIVVKLNTFLQEMTPRVAATIIKEGMNPYKLTIDQMIRFIEQRKISGLENNIAETLVTMEENQEITRIQREALVGLYRIVQGVSQEKEAVMGYLFKNKLPMTLENLEKATKTIKKRKGLHLLVDDSLGEREEIKYKHRTAKQLLERGEDASKEVLENIKHIEQRVLREVREEQLYPYIKEQFKKILGESNRMHILPKSFLEKIEKIKQVDKEVMHSLVAHKIPVTLNNIYWMSQLRQHPDMYEKLMNESGLIKEEWPEDLKEVEQQIEEMVEQSSHLKEEALVEGEINQYKKYKALEELMSLQKHRMKEEGMYQIPFVVEGSKKWVNLYIHKEERSKQYHKKHVKVTITYPTEHAGMIKAYIDIKDKEIKFNIKTNQQESHKKIQDQQEKLVKKLIELGYSIEDKMNESEEILMPLLQSHHLSQFEELI